jgi:hypothetical protein
LFRPLYLTRMEIHFKIIGVLLIALALVHIIFPKFFNWKDELKSLSLINRQMINVHTFFIALTVFLMGLLCLTCTSELIETNLGKKISLGIGVFWTVRLLVQFFIYSREPQNYGKEKHLKRWYILCFRCFGHI